MPLDLRWVDRIHARLLVRYGTRWSALWANVPMDAVRLDWAEALDRCSAESIAYAFEQLPPEFPPTAEAFRRLCLSAPRPNDLPALPAPRGETAMGDDLRRRMAEAAARAAAGGATPAQRCYANIARIVADRGGQWSRMQREWVQQAHDKGLIDASQHGFVRQQEAA